MTRPIILGLLLLATPTLARAQTTSAAERRAVDRAERLLETDRPDDAAGVLEELLDAEPGATEALALLRGIYLGRGQAARFLSRVDAAAERAPRDPEIRRLRIGALIDAGLTEEALAAAESWAAGSPTEPSAVIALADAATAAGDTSRALDALAGAEARVEDPGPLRRRRADLALAAGDYDDAVDAWRGLLATVPASVDVVAEDLASAGDATGSLLARLASTLDGPGVEEGALVALRLGDAEVARGLAGNAATGDRAAFLREYVREADRARLAGEVSWAATELVRLSPRPIDRLRWRAMAADRALVAGDSAGARDAFDELAATTTPGDPPHEMATRRLFELLSATGGSLDEAERLLDRYAAQYPDSVRTRAELVGRLAHGYAMAGDLEAAESRIETARSALGAGVTAPLEAAAALIAWYAGARDSVIARLGRALADPDLSPADHTARLQAATVLQAADSAEVALSGRIALGLRRDPTAFDPGPALRELAGLPASPGRAGLLLHLAELCAGAGRDDVAAGLRRRVADAYPGGPEAPAALLALARAETAPGPRREWLERLIVGYPDSALAPIARRLLAEMEGGTSG